MEKTKTNLFAFTLIELLVVVAIMGIAATIILVDWSGARTKQQLDTSAREVEALIREGQNYALTGFQRVAGSEPCAFRVTWGGSDYSLTYRYKSAGACTQSLVLQSYTLANGITFSAASSVDFTLPHGDFSGATRTIVLSKLSTFHTVCVYTNGLINNIPGAACP